jgi:cytosine/adenosine deaminase-related metal-dependent hydrolase
MSTTLIEGGTVVSMDPDVEDLPRGDVLVEDGRIAAVGADLSDQGGDRIDAADAVVVPGFVNAHLHAYQSLFRGIAGDWTLLDYVQTVHGPIDAALAPRDLYLGTLFSAYEQVQAGTTTVFDFCHAVNSEAHADRAIDALEDSGIRAVFAHGPPNGTPHREAWHDDSTRTHPDYIRDLREGRLADDDARVTLGMAARGPDFTTVEVAKADLRLARELGVPASMHAGVSTYESYDVDGLLALLDEGLLGPETSLVHGNSLTDGTVDRLADAGVPVVVTPEIELQLGYEWPATGPLLAAGRGPSVGSDIVSNVSGDMFTQMRMALQTQRALDNVERLERGEQVTELTVDAREALAWATTNAARDIGLGDEVGSLTPGKRADVTLISTADLNTAPGHSPVDTVVFQANPANVDTVLVGGEVLKRDGSLVDPPSPSLRAEHREAAGRLLDEAGVGP